MKKNRILKRVLIPITLFATLIIGAQIASASRMIIPRQLCSLATYPFNPTSTGIWGSALQPYVNTLSDAVCKNHVTVPSSTPFTSTSFSPQPVEITNDLPLASGSENIKGLIAKHIHSHFNDSLEDSNYYFHHIVAEFKINFSPDTKQNIKLDEVTCDTPVPPGTSQTTKDQIVSILGDCNGYFPSLWGGTRVSKDSNGVTWKFCQDSSCDFPYIYGKNPTLDPWIREQSGNSSYNSSNEDFRKMQFAVNLPTKELDQEAWSATTTSQVLLRDYRIKKTDNTEYLTRYSNQVGDDATGWYPIESLSGYQEQGVTRGNATRPFYWFPIGTVSSVWRQPETTTSNLYCDQIELIAPENGRLDADGETDIQLRVTAEDTDGNPVDERIYTRVSFEVEEGEGTFEDDRPQVYTGEEYTNTFTTSSAEATTVRAYVDFFDDADTRLERPGKPDSEPDCVTGLTLVPEEENPYICKSIEPVEPPPFALQAPGTSPLAVTVNITNADGTPTSETFETTVNWVAQQNSGEFTQSSETKNNDETFRSTFNTDQDSASAIVRVTEIDGPVTLEGTECADGLQIPPETEGGQCLELEVSADNEINVGDSILVSPSRVLYSAPQPETVQIQWSVNGDSDLTPLITTATRGLTPPCPVFDENPADTGAPVYCSYFFTGNNEGDSLTLEADPNTPFNDDCTYEITVVNDEGDNVCEDLTITQPDEIELSEDNDIEVEVTFEDGQDYEIEVTFDGSNGEFDENNDDTYVIRQSSADIFEATFVPDNDASRAGVTAKVTEIFDDARNSNACEDGDEVSTPDDECEYLEIEVRGDEVCIEEIGPSDYEDTFIFEENGYTVEKTTVIDDCISYDRNATYYVYAENAEKVCNDRIEPSPERPPELFKEIKVGNTYTRSPLTLSHQIENVPIYYRLTIVPYGTTTTTLTDDIGKGFIEAEILPVDAEGQPSPGRIDYRGITSINEDGFGRLESCEPPDDGEEDYDPEHCYFGDLGSPSGITLVQVDGRVTIEYEAVLVESGLTNEICRNGQVCQEKYSNKSRLKKVIVNEKEYSGELPYSNETIVQIFCQYILTRAAGDIFLETDLRYGIDINICTDYSTTPGLVVTPGPPTPGELSKTGKRAELQTISHEICSQGQEEGIVGGLYGSDVSELSSTICEVKLQTGSPWRQSYITNNITENKTRVSRWGADPTLPADIGSLLNTAPDQEVYHVNQNLRTTGPVALDDGTGAKTFIIEDADLYIDHNITYTGICPANVKPCNVRDTASIAFIVLNGSVYVDPSVTDIAGVFFVQEGDRANSGQLFSGTVQGEQSLQPLTINGSVYGDIEALFRDRVFAGDPSKDEGGITIRFDQRILLNTPPGLRDVLDLSQTEVAR
ncbi:hypothetical protein GF340_03190 [Candidatus Peregrinibacteria bacterium]|nr:hypothetical protein [Candidatus Peregrinibacteria bacterium]